MSTVLLAENDVAVSSLLSQILRRAGLTVSQAFDGEAACLAVKESCPDLLVCDLDMPKKNGLSLLTELAHLPAPPPTMVVSGYLDASIGQQLTALPFVREVLRKPFDLLGFAAKVKLLAGVPSPAEADA